MICLHKRLPTAFRFGVVTVSQSQVTGTRHISHFTRHALQATETTSHKSHRQSSIIPTTYNNITPSPPPIPLFPLHIVFHVPPLCCLFLHLLLQLDAQSERANDARHTLFVVVQSFLKTVGAMNLVVHLVWFEDQHKQHRIFKRKGRGSLHQEPSSFAGLSILHESHFTERGAVDAARTIRLVHEAQGQWRGVYSPEALRLALHVMN